MWNTLRKTCLFGLALLGFAFVSLVNSKNVNAATLSTSSFDLNYNNTYAGTYYWKNNILYGYNNGVTLGNNGAGVRRYQWNTPSLTPSGNSAVIHFETNIVASSTTSYPTPGQFVNLDRIAIGSCAMGGRTLTIKASSIATAITNWTSNGYSNVTLTIYGDVALDNLPTSGSLVCSIGSSDYQFYTNYGITDTIYFEQNPMIIEYSSNINDLLLQTQINQNNTIINQNQQIIDGQNATNAWLKDNTPPNVDSSGLAQSAGWLPAGPVDSILTIPITLLTGIVNVFTNPSACQAVQLPLPFVNTNIDLPCVGPILDQIGITPLWNIVGAIIGFFLIWNTYKWLYEFVDKTLTFRENNSSIWGGL